MHQIFEFHDAVVDTRTGRVVRAGRTLALEPRTFDVLLYLLQHPGQLVSHGDLLDRVWGDTNVTAHSLTQAISQLRRSLDDGAQEPRFIQTVHRRGYMWVAPVEVFDAPAPVDRTSGSGPWNVPAGLIKLIGREGLIDTVTTKAIDSRVVTLIGAGGVGKTQLALEAGRRVAGSFDDGALFVDMTYERDVAGVARAMARALRIDGGDDTASLEAVAAAFRDRNLLLLLDNCEQVAEAIGTLTSALVTSCPRVHVLVTTQRKLEVSGQVLVRVPPLETPDVAWTPAGASEWPASVRLFVERANSINPDFRLTPQNATAIAEVCRRLDGIPLALELAAARTNVLTPEQIAERLDERFQLLSGQPAALPRHQALHAAISWSVSLLSECAQRLLDRMAVFSGGWTFDAAEAVVGQEAPGLVDDLSDLVDKSLVTVDVDRPQARYRLLDSIRLYAQTRLTASAEYRSIRDRHLTYFCRFAQQVERDVSADPVPWLRRVREEHANLLEAFAWAVSLPDKAEQALELCCNLRWVWRLEGNYVESREWLVQALAAAPSAPLRLTGRAWIVLGLVQHHRGEIGQSRSSIENGLSQLPSEEQWERTFGSILLAFVETLAGQLDRGDALAAIAEVDAERLGDDQLLGFARLRAAMAHGLQRSHHEAVKSLTEAGEYLKRGRDPFLFLFSRLQLGLQYFLAGDLSSSRAVAIESLQAACEIDNLRAIAGTIETLAYLAVAEEDVRGACRLLGTAARLRELTAAPLFENFLPSHRHAIAAVSESLGTAVAAREMQTGALTPVADVLAALLAR